MVKVVNLVSLLVAPLILSVAKQGGTMRVAAYVLNGLFLVVAVAIILSKREAEFIMEPETQPMS